MIAQSFERIHRSNLLGMGILPLQFRKDEGPVELGIKGNETFTFNFNEQDLKIGQEIEVETSTG